MNHHPLDNDALDTALRRQLGDSAPPGDAGFTLRVMAALPAAQPPARQRWALALRHAQRLASGIAAGGVAALLSGTGAPLDTAHALAVLALVGLAVLWAAPARH